MQPSFKSGILSGFFRYITPQALSPKAPATAVATVMITLSTRLQIVFFLLVFSISS